MFLKQLQHLKSNRLVLLSTEILFLFLFLSSGCQHTVQLTFTTRDIIRFLVRDNPGIFSNSFLDTSRASLAGTDFFFSRSFTVNSSDTTITLNDLDTVSLNPYNIVAKTPRDVGAEVSDTLIGQLKFDSAGSARPPRNFRLPVTKFGYFQKLQSDAFENRGWYLLGATQTFVGTARMLDSVRLHATNSGLNGYTKDTLILRRSRNPAVQPLNDPQVSKVRTNPFQLKPGDSVEVRAWVKISTFDTVYVFCHINDLSTKRRIQLAEVSPGEFFGGFRLSGESGLNYQFRRLAVDALAQSVFTNGSFDNEIWGLIYQVYP